MPSLADDERAFLVIATGVSVGSISDLRRIYYAALSGLPTQRSEADHMYDYLDGVVTPVGSLSDLEYAFLGQAPQSLTGTLSDRRKAYF